MLIISRVSKEPEVRQAELMDAAEELFISAGYQQTTVSMIVKKVGVAQGTFYYHFASKEVILEAIFDRYIRKMILEVHSAYARQNTALEKLQLFFKLFYKLCYYDESGLIAKILYKEKQGQLINKLWRQTLIATTPILRCILEQGNREGVTRVIHMDETLSFFAGIMASLLEASSPSEFGHEADPAVMNNKLKIAGNLIEALLGLQAASIQFDLPEKEQAQYAADALAPKAVR
ncbi:transcriptional regulator, TetR family [Dendrosporobacter quercicolus]|uniref:Transcriptional regulator, TetR family n=1 Tax=Dendrosporobacter quercicolus TaxID=146817 RepID=A0A1G9MUC6_9FIRM|nr:transcriptional regulator, TetR family [Dendrosporobacter quercicolus]